MEMMTVKRNGIFISFPAMEHNPIKGEVVIADVKVNTPVKKQPKRQVRKPVVRQQINVGYVKMQQPKRVEAKGPKCSRCGDVVVYMRSPYCWECYKYEHYESR